MRKIIDATTRTPVAEMPLALWWLLGITGLWGGFVIASFRWDYGTERKWYESLLSGHRLWRRCRNAGEKEGRG